MKAFIFTHPMDYEISYLSYQSLEESGCEVVLCYDKRDKKPNGNYKSIMTTFPRLGNLNGPKFMNGALDLYIKEGAGHDIILKVDSDTLVFNTDWVKKDYVLTGFEYEPYRPFFGMAYAMQYDSLPLIKEVLESSKYDLGFPEDIMMHDLCKELGVYRYAYDPDNGPWAGWNWFTLLDEAEYRKRFSVINVYRPNGFEDMNARKIVHMKMRELLAAGQ
jgi:hypothetical protein